MDMEMHAAFFMLPFSCCFLLLAGIGDLGGRVVLKYECIPSNGCEAGTTQPGFVTSGVSRHQS